MDKRYQVFVSSTFADLEDERKKIMQTLMEMDCIPAGMELFPAADEEQMQFIEKVIDDCDYYLLLIGGRYGSTTLEGVSYTEKEYDYALSKGIKVIALLHKNPSELSLAKSDRDPVAAQRLESFRNKAASGRLVKFWNTVGDLPGLVSLSLTKTIKAYPAIGWIRGNAIASEDLLRQINELRQENQALRSSELVMQSKPKLDDLAPLDSTFEISGGYTGHDGEHYRWARQFSWRDLFWHIAPYLDAVPTDASLKGAFEESLRTETIPDALSFYIGDQPYQSICIQLRALGLASIDKEKSNGVHRRWSLTPLGERLMFEVRTAKRQAQ